MLRPPSSSLPAPDCEPLSAAQTDRRSQSCVEVAQQRAGAREKSVRAWVGTPSIVLSCARRRPSSSLAVLHCWASPGVIVVGDGQRGKSKGDERGKAKALAALHHSTNLQLKEDTVAASKERGYPEDTGAAVLFAGTAALALRRSWPPSSSHASQRCDRLGAPWPGHQARRTQRTQREGTLPSWRIANTGHYAHDEPGRWLSDCCHPGNGTDQVGQPVLGPPFLCGGSRRSHKPMESIRQPFPYFWARHIVAPLHGSENESHRPAPERGPPIAPKRAGPRAWARARRVRTVRR